MNNRRIQVCVVGLALLLIATMQFEKLEKTLSEKLPYMVVQRAEITREEVTSKEDLTEDTPQNIDQEEKGKEEEEEEEEENGEVNSNLSLAAVGAVLMDAQSNRILYSKNGDEELAMASTTKIMTLLVTLEKANLDDVVTVSKYAASMPDVQLNMKTGEQFYLKDLVYSLMLESHNDTAVAIAEHVGGTVEKFAELMNQKAAELGCTHTHFVTPNGLDAQEHYTTPIELATIASYAMKNDTFVEIINTVSHEFKEITTGKTYSVMNKNRFLYLMDGANGIKTGFTNNAGYCFVGSIEQDGKQLISVVLGSGWPPNKTYKWKDTTTLMNYGLNNFNKQILINKRVELDQIPVIDGQEPYVSIYTEGNLSTLIRTDEEVTVKTYLNETVEAPVKEQEKVGEVQFYINDELYQTVPIYTEDSVKKINFSYCFHMIMRCYTNFMNSQLKD